MEAWADKYIGIPFVDHGRSYDGMDCWGLAKAVLKNEFGVDLPDLGERYKSIKDTSTITRLVDETKPLVDARQVDRPAPGDLAVIMYKGAAIHIGVYVGGGYVLHTNARIQSMLERVKSPNLKSRIEGWYRIGKD